MRGRSPKQPHMFYVVNVEERIAQDHPLRAIKALVDQDLAALSAQFTQAYSDYGRPGVPPERLLKALLLQALFSLRSERQLVQRIDTDLLFRWFLDMDPAQDVFDATAFTHNRKRLDEHGITQAFFAGTVRRALKEGLASPDHFSVDGTLIDSFASMKSFVHRDQLPAGAPGDSDAKDPKDKGPGKGPDAGDGAGGTRGRSGDSNSFKPRNVLVDFHGQKRTNATHASKTDHQARLFKKGRGQPARLAHMGHLIAENRHGLVLAVKITTAAGDAEPQAALDMLDRIKEIHRVVPKTLGADKGFDAGPFLLQVESRHITPHVAVRAKPIGGPSLAHFPAKRQAAQARQRAFDRMRTPAYALSQKLRKKIEEAIGWSKTIAGLARTKLVGHWKITQQLEVAAAAYNTLRLAKLLRRT